jgi:taurine--2-oxoglutarate transaminase
VRDRKSKQPFNTREDKIAGKTLTVDRVASQCMKDGVYVVSWINNLIVAPPLIIGRKDIDRGIAALDKSLDIADREII